MLLYWLFFIVFGMIILIWPEFLAYIIASFFIIIWINILSLYFIFKPKVKDVVNWEFKVIKK